MTASRRSVHVKLDIRRLLNFSCCVFSLCLHCLQILAGLYPVSQLQEPYSSVGYLCERVPFLSVLKLKHPSLVEEEPPQGDQKPEEPSWTAWDVCEGRSVLTKSDSTLAVALNNDGYIIYCRIYDFLNVLFINQMTVK